MLSELHHPNIVQFLGVHYSKADMPAGRARENPDDEDDPRIPILVMEYLPMTASVYVEQSEPPPPRPLPPDSCYSILHDVVLGLRYLHERNPSIVHRDLTANNILLTKNLVAKIADLGVARILDVSHSDKLTRAPGNVSYMPPEALSRKPVYHTPVDIFSFGVLILHIFCREWPFPDDQTFVPDLTKPDRMEVRTEVQRREVYIKKLGEDHPLRELILSCLSNQPEKRPSARIVLQTIQAVQVCLPSSSHANAETRKLLSKAEDEVDRLKEELAQKASTMQSMVEDVERLNAESQSVKDENARLVSSLEQSRTDATKLAQTLEEMEAQVMQKDRELAEKDLIIGDLKHQVSFVIWSFTANRLRVCLYLYLPD